MSQIGINPSMTTSATLTACLRERIADYDRLNGDGNELTLIKEVHRRFCRLYLFRLTSSGRPDLVVKVPVGHSDVAYETHRHDPCFVDRPRLFERAVPESKSSREYAALCRIQTHFDAKPDRRFGVVRVYDLLPENQAMVLQWIDQPSLRALLYKTHRLANVRRARQLEGAFHHAGAWLRWHHALPSLPHAEIRNTSRDAYLDAVEKFVAYLTNHVSDGDEMRQMHQRIVALAHEHIPTTVPTGQVHGDFAPRNIFVGHGNRVSIFDTLGRFEAPIYEDIAKMLMTVQASGPQLFSRGLFFDHNRLTRFEQHFLEGYFSDQPIPLPTIRLFLAQQLLEHWSAVVYRHQQQRGVKRLAKGLRRTIWQSGFRSYLRHIISIRG
ncbi:MAG: phosphotransferase [Candidatus Paceibacterota bacterium]